MALKILASDAVNTPPDQLDSWGFRAGAKVEGTCAISGKSISKENGVSTGIWEVRMHNERTKEGWGGGGVRA